MKFQSNSPGTENKNISSQPYILATAFLALMAIVGLLFTDCLSFTTSGAKNSAGRGQ